MITNEKFDIQRQNRSTEIDKLQLKLNENVLIKQYFSNLWDKNKI